MKWKITYLTLLLSVTLTGQFNCLFEHYSTDDGLSHGSIGTIMKDSKGFMWFGSWDGLNKFDGYNFTVYKSKPGDNISLSSNRIEELIEDKWGYIWLRTYDQNIYRFDPGTEKFEPVINKNNDEGEKINFVNIFHASTEDFWLYSNNNGLYRVLTNPVTHQLTTCFYPVNGIFQFIHEDDKNQIWIGTDVNLKCFTYNNSDNFYNEKLFNTNIALNHYFTCCFEKDNFLFLGTKEGKLINHNLIKNTWETANLNNSSPISTINTRTKNILFIGTLGNGIFKYNYKNNKIINHNNQKIIQYVYSVYIDSRNLLWIELDKEGIAKADSSLAGIKYFAQKSDIELTLQVRTSCSFYENKDKVLWIILKGGGFGYYNAPKDKLEYFYNNPDDPTRKMSNYANVFFYDTTDVLWICTYYKGIEKITFLENKFKLTKLEQHSKNRISNEVRSLFEDSQNNLWVGTKLGKLYILDKNYRILKKLSDGNALNNGLVYSIIEDRNNNIWLGTKGKGLFKASAINANKNDYRFKQFVFSVNENMSISGDQIYSVYEDSKGRIWIGTYGNGLNLLRYENGNIYFKNNFNSFYNYPQNKGLRIRNINEDKNGNIWLATTEGLIVFNPNINSPDNYQFTHIKKIPGKISSLGNNDVFYIFKDKKGILWFGTQGGGLNQLINYDENNKVAEFKVYTKNDGLPSDIIFSIEEDFEGNLWLSTENGISKFNKQNQTFINFNEYDGIQPVPLSEATSCIRSNGEICFGSYDGIYSFLPENLSQTKRKINLYITRFSVFNKEILPGEKHSPLKKAIFETSEIELKHNQNMFTIEYAGIDYRAQQKIQYSYILENLDKNWHYVKNQNTATYTNIPPGKYIFKVKIANPEFIESAHAQNLKITIKPPLWKTTWAYIGYVILLLIIIEIARRIIVAMIRLRNKVIVEKELTELKLKFFTNISHELRTPLSLILTPAEEIAEKEKLSPQGTAYIQLVKNNAKRMLQLINQLLDFRKIQNKKMSLKLSQINIAPYINEICTNFNELAKEKKIKFNVNANINDTFVWIDEEKISVVLFNLLSNAFKFTPEGKKIEVNLINEKNKIIIEVCDEGIGISKDKFSLVFSRFSNIYEGTNTKISGSGIGLALSKELIDLHNGNLFFKSEENKGTSFTIELKLGTEHFDKNIVDFLNKDNTDFDITLKQTGLPELSEKVKKEIKSDDENPVLLIVEDNDDLRKFIGSLFSNSFTIIEAINGRLGLEKTIKALPDLIISDVMMPEMDGIELINELKNNFETSHIPIILLTAKSSVESKIEGLKYGADAYITKPFNSKFLIAQVKNLLNQRKKLLEKYTSQVKILDIKPLDITVTDRDNEFLQTVINVIEKNIGNANFKIENITQEIGLGRTSFFKKMKGLTGISPVDFVIELRLKKAYQILETKQYNISETAYMTGFNDPGYFSKRFKEKYNISPSGLLKS